MSKINPLLCLVDCIQGVVLTNAKIRNYLNNAK
jgi:hypothetical protein